jgi:hypothetical protein
MIHTIEINDKRMMATGERLYYYRPYSDGQSIVMAWRFHGRTHTIPMVPYDDADYEKTVRRCAAALEIGRINASIVQRRLRAGLHVHPDNVETYGDGWTWRAAPCGWDAILPAGCAPLFG